MPVRRTRPSVHRPPTNITLNEHTALGSFGNATDKWVNAPPGRRPTDGEADTTHYAQPSVGTVVRSDYSAVAHRALDVLYNAPAHAKKLLLTGLFGVALGTVIDRLLGGPLGLTSKLVRLLIRLLPGGSILLSLFDAASSLFGHLGADERAAKTVLDDPRIVRLAQSAKPFASPEAAEKLVEIAANKEAGGGNSNAVLLAVANALYLALSRKIRGKGIKIKKRGKIVPKLRTR